MFFDLGDRWLLYLESIGNFILCLSSKFAQFLKSFDFMLEFVNAGSHFLLMIFRKGRDNLMYVSAHHDRSFFADASVSKCADNRLSALAISCL